MFLYFWCLQTHAFPDDEQDTPADAGFVDVADVAVARTLNAFGGFTVDHHRASANDLINFWGRRAVLEVATIEPKFFLYPFNLGVRGLVMADVKFSTNHVCNQHRKSLSGASCCPNWSCEVNRNKLGAVNVVEEAHFTDPFQRSHQNSLGQHGQTDSKPDVDGFLQIISLLPEATRDGLSHHDRGGFTVVLFKH